MAEAEAFADANKAAEFLCIPYRTLVQRAWTKDIPSIRLAAATERHGAFGLRSLRCSHPNRSLNSRLCGPNRIGRAGECFAERLEIAVGGKSIIGVVDAILKVSKERKAILDRLRTALESGDADQALELARQLCGLKDEQSNRVN